jgi:hypothetical protein
MELVENEIGFVNDIHSWWPEIMIPLEWRWSTGSTGSDSWCLLHDERQIRLMRHSFLRWVV